MSLKNKVSLTLLVIAILILAINETFINNTIATFIAGILLIYSMTIFVFADKKTKSLAEVLVDGIFFSIV